MKTSHFADHPLDDVIEKIACQFTARHVRGRPRPPFWYPGWPLYVCDSRYNDRERIFVKIKNWNSCVPEEVRKSAEFMPIYPFEKVVFPRRFASPFLVHPGLKAPGGIGDMLERGEGEKIEGGGIGRKRQRRGVVGVATGSRSELTDRVGQSKGLYVGPHLHGSSAATAAQATAPAQTPPAFQTYLPLPVVATAGGASSVQPAGVGAGSSSSGPDRSIINAAGGAAALGGNAVAEKLPPETGTSTIQCPGRFHSPAIRHDTNPVVWLTRSQAL